MVPLFLRDLVGIPRPGSEHADTFEAFTTNPLVAALGWPDDVVEQWLWEHGRYDPFLSDYGHIDLSSIQWCDTAVSTAALLTVTTGASEHGLLEENARLHQHWVSVREPTVAEAWETTGTWLRRPVLIDRGLIDASMSGLQVIEGRTRIGVLWGRATEGLKVASNHAVWVGQKVSGLSTAIQTSANSDG